MVEQDPFNISKKPEENKDPSKDKKITPPPPVKNQEEMDALFKKIYEYHDLVQQRVEQALGLTSLSREQITRYLDNPANFTKEEWNTVQTLRKSYAEMTAKALGQKSEKKTQAEKQKILSEEEKKRKGKTLGGRRKWLPM